VGKPFTWTITISNTGAAAAPLSDATIIFTDNLRGPPLAYGPVSVLHESGIMCAEHISCTIETGPDLQCTSGGGVLIDPGGSFDVRFAATPSASGTFTNPRASGICRVDPDLLVTEGDETNNDCSDTVVVHFPATIAFAGDDLRIEWSPVPAKWFWIWTSEDDPYVAPGEFCDTADNCTEVPGTSTSYVDTGAGTDFHNHFYVVQAVGGLGGRDRISNGVGKFRFVLNASPDDREPVIEFGPIVGRITSTSAMISWSTDEDSDSEVQYDTGPGTWGSYAYPERVSEATTTHSVELTGLSPNTQYFFRVGSTDPFGNGPTVSGEDDFTTLLFGH
jgi:hypothetical protein